MEKHEQIVRDLNDEFKKLDRAYELNEMRIFGRNTGRIFKELDVIRRKQLDLASEHFSLDDIPPLHQMNNKSSTSKQELLFSSKNFDKKEIMLKHLMEKLDDLTQAMNTFNNICEYGYEGNDTLIISDDEYEESEEFDDYSVAKDNQYLKLPAANNK